MVAIRVVAFLRNVNDRGVKNGTVSELSRIIRYYSDRECGKNPSMIITTMYSLHVVADP